jgi:cytochrome c oxidase subunit 2
MEINRYERIWMSVAIAAIVLMLVGVTMAGYAMGVQMPGASGIVDPRSLKDQPPFDKPGLTDLGSGKYEAVIVAQAWKFNPLEITVPTGAEVTFKITSRDVSHGLLVENTNINTMIIPGQVTQFTVRFTKSGTFQFVCHEYCGVGHQTMAGKIIVQP